MTGEYKTFPNLELAACRALFHGTGYIQNDTKNPIQLNKLTLYN